MTTFSPQIPHRTGVMEAVWHDNFQHFSGSVLHAKKKSIGFDNVGRAGIYPRIRRWGGGSRPACQDWP